MVAVHWYTQSSKVGEDGVSARMPNLIHKVGVAGYMGDRLRHSIWNTENGVLSWNPISPRWGAVGLGVD